MGKVLAIVGGLIAVILGVYGLIAWWSSFILVIKGTIPAFLILGGIIALVAGIGEIKDAIARKREEKEEKKKEEEKPKEEEKKE